MYVKYSFLLCVWNAYLCGFLSERFGLLIRVSETRPLLEYVHIFQYLFMAIYFHNMYIYIYVSHDSVIFTIMN